MTLSRRSLLISSALGIAGTTIAGSAPRIFARQATPAVATPAGMPEIESAMLATMDELGIPGAVVLLDSPETGTWTTALGYADLESSEPMTVDTHMRVGSITKTFTATMILQLVDQGLLTLDDTIDTLHPDLAALANADTISVRHLLSMQSGLPDYVQTPMVQEFILDPTADVAPSDLIASIVGQPALFAPGSEFMYSNTNYMLLSVIAESLTDTSWIDLVQTGILDEIGLANTSVPTTPEIPSPASRGYAWPQATGTPEAGIATPIASPVVDPATAGPVDVTTINVLVPGAAGAIISTVGDLHTWSDAFLAGTLLSPEMHAAQFDTSNAPEADGVRYGLGVIDLAGAFGHTGGIDGFESIMLSVPGMDITAIVLVNVLPPRVPTSATQELLQHVVPM